MDDKSKSAFVEAFSDVFKVSMLAIVHCIGKFGFCVSSFFRISSVLLLDSSGDTIVNSSREIVSGLFSLSGLSERLLLDFMPSTIVSRSLRDEMKVGKRT
jgi:hypothetical protein